jgi:hypothetical protein
LPWIQTNHLDQICIDESMSRWYGKGGDWINDGLPHYVAIERKPENGCEIQTSCCGTSGIMMGLRVVKQEEVELEEGTKYAGFGHGLKVMLNLLEGWTPGRIVCADSYFASVQAAVVLATLGWRFIGVVKTATKLFPQAYLSSVELPTRGSCVGVKGRDHEYNLDLLAFVFCDRNRQYFISSCSNISPGPPIKRSRVQQVADVESNEDPEMVDMTLDCPKAAATYYSTCGKIDQHNRCRQDSLNLEKKIKVKQWDQRVNMSIFGMIVVDSWLLYKGCTGGKKLHQIGYYKALMDALIDSPLKNTTTTRQQQQRFSASDASVASWATKTGTAGRGLHLTPTKHKTPTKKKDRRRQQHCRNCNAKTIMLCSYCRDNPEIGEEGAAYCCPTTGRDCYSRHMDHCH